LFRKIALEESLALSESFCDAINTILEWLFAIEPSLSPDAPVHGDVETVDTLLSSHEVLFALT